MSDDHRSDAPLCRYEELARRENSLRSTTLPRLAGSENHDGTGSDMSKSTHDREQSEGFGSEAKQP